MSKINLIFLIIYLSQLNFLEGKKDLFDETQFKYMKMKNRVFKGGIADTDFFEDGKIKEKGFKKYEELSKLGIGAIITGGMLIEKNEHFAKLKIPTLEKDEYIDELKKWVDLVHKNGSNLIAQVFLMNDLDMPVDEIHRLTELFGDAIVRVKKAGFDGVEIGACHHGTLSQFLSPMFNHRTDEYGGSNENRARFITEIIKKIREKVGKEYILILKINSEDNDPNGITPEGFITACKMAEDAGIDMIDVTGMKWKKNKENKMVYFDIGKTLAEILKIPVMITGGAKDLNVINDVLNNSKIEYIGICRAILSEPDILIRWKNCDDKKSRCVSCMKCYPEGYTDFSNEECIFNRKKPKKNLK